MLESVQNMKAPSFWWEKQISIIAHILRPLGRAYGAVTAWRMGASGENVVTPVICVGNFTVGGAGKTPVVQALCRLLKTKYEGAFVLSRGYGGTLAGPVRVDRQQHTAAQVGDEPLLHAQDTPVIVAKKKTQGAQLAIAQGARLLIMDDGLQNPALRKDLTISVVDGEVGWGNGLCFPAGPLRAPLAAQWPRTDALVIVGQGAAVPDITQDAQARGIPVFCASLVPDPDVVRSLQGHSFIAFAGIGRPQKFFESVQNHGAHLHAQYAFADHRPYPQREIEQLLAESLRANVSLITTTKDMARLTPAQRVMLSDRLKVLPVHLVFEDEPAFESWLFSALKTI
jgi:tetraacyldisaccharide 4'-kinase